MAEQSATQQATVRSPQAMKQGAVIGLFVATVFWVAVIAWDPISPQRCEVWSNVVPTTPVEVVAGEGQ